VVIDGHFEKPVQTIRQKLSAVTRGRDRVEPLHELSENIVNHHFTW
jgi:hypothetical protein